MSWLEKLDPRVRSSLIWLGTLSVLVLENAWMFRDHYAGRQSYPWDFSLTYFTVPFYWQGMARIGHFPEWIPYQGFGYPMQINLQSGIFYPPLWVLVLFRITYSLAAATIFQTLHVLAGAIGATWLARTRGLSRGAALLAGCAYQLFGGFFSNAEHVDIVRGYALLPWLLAALTIAGGESGRRPSLRALMVAPLTLFFATGVYPGQFLATLALAFFYLTAQVLDVRADRDQRIRAARAAAIRGAAMFLGIAMAAVSLVPGWAMKSELFRSQQYSDLKRSTLVLNHLFTTLFGYDVPWLTEDVTMRSMFVTVPIVLGLFFVGWTELKRQRALLLVACAAGLMIQGGSVFQLVTRLVSPLAYSRLPFTDYRALLALPMVILGAEGIARLLEGSRLSWLAVRVAALAAFVLYAADRWNWSQLAVREIGDLALVLTATVLLAWLGQLRALPRVALFAIAIALVLYDGRRMHTLVSKTWHGPPADPSHQVSNYTDALRTLQKSARTALSRRPVRVKGGYLYERQPPNFSGYLRGRWSADDYAASDHLRVTQAILSDAEVANYLRAESAPRLIDPASAGRGPRAALGAAPVGEVSPYLYSANQIGYAVTAPSAAILVENEPAFPGWRAVAHCDEPSSMELQPVAALWPLRAWSVPPGKYKICERFTTPGLRASAVLSLLALLVWLTGVAWTITRAFQADPARAS